MTWYFNISSWTREWNEWNEICDILNISETHHEFSTRVKRNLTYYTGVIVEHRGIFVYVLHYQVTWNIKCRANRSICYCSLGYLEISKHIQVHYSTGFLLQSKCGEFTIQKYFDRWWLKKKLVLFRLQSRLQHILRRKW